jgi:hypothetical protein
MLIKELELNGLREIWKDWWKDKLNSQLCDHLGYGNEARKGNGGRWRE